MKRCVSYFNDDSRITRKKIRVLLCGNPTNDLSITSSHVLPLSYRSLVEARPLNLVKVTIIVPLY